MNYYAFSSLLNMAAMAFAAILIVFAKQKPKHATPFFLYALSSFVWALGYFFWQLSGTKEEAMIWIIVLMIPIAFNTPALFHFISSICGTISKRKPIIALGYVLGTILSISFVLRPDLLVSSLVPQKLGLHWYPTSGIIFDLFMITFVAFFGLALFDLIGKINRSTKEDAKSLRLILATIGITYIGGLPNGLLWYLPIPPITNAITGVFFITIAFLLIKGTFYHVQLLYFEITASLLLLVGGLQFLLTEEIVASRILNLMMFLAVAGIAFFLMRSGKRERLHLEKITILNKKLEDSINNVINGIDAAVMVINKNGKIEYTNSRALWMFDYNQQSAPKQLSFFVKAEQNPQLLSAYAKYQRTGQSHSTAILMHRDVERVDVNFGLFPLQTGENATLMMIIDRRPPWGTVFNSKTLEPIPLTIIRAFNEHDKLITTQVTDPFGRFGLMVPPGRYVVRAENPNFKAGYTEKKIGYQGEPITVSKEKMMDVNVNILLDQKD